jgi:hypothetical protein
MELARDNFLFSFQSTAQNPWVIIGPHPVLGSVTYISFATLQAALDWWGSEEARIAENPQILEPPETAPPAIEPTFEPIDPGEVAAPPETDPATGQTQIDPPAPPPLYPPPLPRGTRGGLWETIGQILGSIFGGGTRSRYPAGGGYPPGGTPGRAPGAGGGLLGTGDEWLYLAAAGLLVLAATQKKKKGTHAAR